MAGLAKTTLRVGMLHGGGVVLGWTCPSRCRHCLYACGPHRRDGVPADAGGWDRLLSALAERAPGAGIHVGGGEPFLDVERLAGVVRGLRDRGMALEYVETNAGWVRDRRHAEETLARLARDGLTSVLVSLSPFHAEFVPLERPLWLIEAAQRTLPGGAFPWMSTFLPDLRAEPADRPLDLDGFLARQPRGYAARLGARYSLVAAGRAGRFLHDHGQAVPWRTAAARFPCPERLADTSHFHVDGEGRYVPGLCGGLAVRLDEVPGEVDLERYPLLADLVAGGPGALVDRARASGFEPAATYASSCDLCTDVRRHLWRQGAADFPELGPPGFYDERSWVPTGS